MGSGLTERVIALIRPLIKGYHRAEVRGLDSFPPGGALVVSNHSGGLFPMDVPVFATGFYEKFGYDRPVYTLSHDVLFTGRSPSSSCGRGSSAPAAKTPTKHCALVG
ncbi:putative acyltransferase domain protein [Mycobacterium xenopi 3993]|nr:putative acyltransferase domain protein [Mycobacterium xenopi 3993]